MHTSNNASNVDLTNALGDRHSPTSKANIGMTTPLAEVLEQVEEKVAKAQFKPVQNIIKGGIG